MLFTSYAFIALVAITFGLYYAKGLRCAQVWILIIASFIFYAYGQPILLALLFISASINALASYQVTFAPTLAHKRLYAWLGVGVNLAVLAFFKYSPLFGRAMESFISTQSIGEFLINVPLPVGISFYTFQGISLVVDLYRDGVKNNDSGGGHTHSLEQSSLASPICEHGFFKHYRNTLFFIGFFPQLVAGPIVKAHEFYPQIAPKRLEAIDFYTSAKILILGYFLKMVIADNLKDQTFWMLPPYFQAYDALTLLALLFGYSVQIFADFAGYSLIAIGVAKLFGYNLPQNFNFPYISASFAEFWRRWHISLSTWLKQYLYIPLGGSRKGKFRTYCNLFIVMALGGLWHGAYISYMVWGVYHGLFLAIERFLRENLKPAFVAHLPRFSKLLAKSALVYCVRVVFVFNVVSFGWILFKLRNFSDVLLYVSEIFCEPSGGRGNALLLMILCYSAPIFAYYARYVVHCWITRKGKNQKTSSVCKYRQIIESALFGVLLFFIFTNSGSSGAFIYFQF
ncbi:MBOAT family O-acyltransferase [Helicobacter himalayensis]|uniref:MBOAT family O-acyltransferase n=1 Tax=Helicobacter himalayensis TaxID=1591088 RepID=UPI003D6F36AE